MSSSINVTLLGDASPGQIAVWVCGVALVILFGALIAKTRGSRDLRFIAYCVLAGILAILVFAYFAASRQPAAKRDEAQAPTTDEPRRDGEYPGNSPDNSPQDTKPPPLQLPHARSGVMDQPKGS